MVVSIFVGNAIGSGGGPAIALQCTMMATSSNDDDCVIQIELQQGPVNPSVYDWPTDCGAEAMFIGRTRTESHVEYGILLHLEYEVYEPMAKKVLGKLARQAAHRWPCRSIRIVHAIGVVEPGCASVVIQVATPHRGETFDACQFLIDRLKQELPIWKHQVWQRGRTFVEGCCACEGTDIKPT